MRDATPTRLPRAPSPRASSVTVSILVARVQAVEAVVLFRVDALAARVEELEQQVRVLEGEVAQALDEAEQQAAGRETALVEVAALRRCTESDGNAGSGAATAAEEKEEDALRRAGEEAAALREQVNSGSY